jgi:hypothetical protein
LGQHVGDPERKGKKGLSAAVNFALIGTELILIALYRNAATGRFPRSFFIASSKILPSARKIEVTEEIKTSLGKTPR